MVYSSGGKDAKRDAGQVPLPAAPTFPEAWDGSIASIRVVLAELYKLPAPGTEPMVSADSGQQEPITGPFSEVAEALRSRVDAAQERMRVPPDGESWTDSNIPNQHFIVYSPDMI